MRSWKVICGLMDEFWADSGGTDVPAPDAAHRTESLDRTWSRLRPAADAGGDGLLGGGMLLADALRRGLDAVRGLERLDLFGQFGDLVWLRRLAAWAVAESPALSWSRKPVNSDR